VERPTRTKIVRVGAAVLLAIIFNPVPQSVNSPTGGVGAGNLPINPVFQELRYAGLRSYVGRMKSEAVDHRAMLVILALHG
jgi:hypothetical protein